MERPYDNSRDRAEHLQWCKDRAAQYLDIGDVASAHASFVSDMGKHSATAATMDGGLMAALGLMEAMSGVDAMRRWIDGFN